MSRIGKAPVAIPKGVDINVNGNIVKVKGSKGELSMKVMPGLEYANENGSFVIRNPKPEVKQFKALHGLYRSLIHNMAIGVSEGFTETLLLVGVGYRAEAKGQVIEMSLGFSHQIVFVVPKDISVATESLKGLPPKITLQGIDKQLLGLVAAKIRAIRPPEPYKGKGVKYATEVIRRKQGKAAGKGKK